MITIIKRSRRLLVTMSVMFIGIASRAVSLDLKPSPAEYRGIYVEIVDNLSSVEIVASYGGVYSPDFDQLLFGTIGQPQQKVTLTKADVEELHRRVRKILSSFTLESSAQREEILANGMPGTFAVKISIPEASVTFGYSPADYARIEHASACYFWLLEKCSQEFRSKIVLEPVPAKKGKELDGFMNAIEPPPTKALMVNQVGMPHPTLGATPLSKDRVGEDTTVWNAWSLVVLLLLLLAIPVWLVMRRNGSGVG